MRTSNGPVPAKLSSCQTEPYTLGTVTHDGEPCARK